MISQILYSLAGLAFLWLVIKCACLLYDKSDDGPNDANVKIGQAGVRTEGEE